MVIIETVCGDCGHSVHAVPNCIAKFKFDLCWRVHLEIRVDTILSTQELGFKRL